MGMRTYGMYEVKVDNSKVKEYAPVSYARLMSLMEEYNGSLYDIYDYEMGLYFTDLSEDEQEKIYSAFIDLRDEVAAATGVTLCVAYIDSEADSDLAGEAVFATALEFSERLDKLGAELIVWTEVG